MTDFHCFMDALEIGVGGQHESLICMRLPFTEPVPQITLGN